MTQQKWFYPAQKVILQYLDDNYSRHSCNYQDVCKFTVHENYSVMIDGNVITSKDIHFVIHKPATKTSIGLIRIFGEAGLLQYTQE